MPRPGASQDQYFVDIMLEDLAIEIDGLGKYAEPDALRVVVEEKLREDDLRDTGLDFHRVFVEHLYASPEHEMRRLRGKWARHVRRRAA